MAAFYAARLQPLMPVVYPCSESVEASVIFAGANVSVELSVGGAACWVCSFHVFSALKQNLPAVKHFKGVSARKVWGKPGRIASLSSSTAFNYISVSLQALRQHIRDAYEARWKAEKHFDEESILEELPPSLRTEASICLEHYTLKH